MEAKSLSLRNPVVNFMKQFFLLLFFLLIVGGCASSKKKLPSDHVENNLPSSASGPSDVSGTYGPPAPRSSTAPVYGPQDTQGTPEVQGTHQGPQELVPVAGLRPRRPVVLVFGPGRARGYAYIGVLRALSEKKIPIGAILGTEMGGLMAALYGMTGNLNSFEWGLLKIKDEIFLKKNGFFSRFSSLSSDKPLDGETLETELKQVFEKKDLKESRIPIRIALQSKETGISFSVSEGNAVQAIRASLATPGMFSPGSWGAPESEQIPVVSASSSRPFLIHEAKKLDLGPVVVVNVLSDEESKGFAEELSQADLVLKPDLKGFGYQDFNRRNEIAFRGKTTVFQHLNEIESVAGLSDPADLNARKTDQPSSENATDAK